MSTFTLENYKAVLDKDKLKEIKDTELMKKVLDN